MNTSLAVVLLPGPGAIAVTLESVRDELGPEVPVLCLTDKDAPHEQQSGFVSAKPHEILAAADVLAFARAGDRWRAGTLAARLRPLSAHPTAMLSVAGFVLVDAEGREIRVARAPMPPIDSAKLLLHPSIEATAVLVRSAALGPADLELIARPHGDAVVWSEIVRRYGLLPSMELAAEIKLDVDRHGHEPHARTEALLTAIRAGTTSKEGPGVRTLRRELLRRLYIEPREASELTEIDIATLFAANATTTVTASVEDLQWALERQRDALAAERLRWADGEVDPVDRIPGATDIDMLDARLKNEELWNELKVRDAEIARLHAELAQREAVVDRLSAAGQSA